VKLSFLILILIGASFASLADSFRPEGSRGEPYQPPMSVEMAWTATNEVPRGMWIYKAVPQTFSMAVISNLVSICGFDWSNISKKPDSNISDKNQFSFSDTPTRWTRHLIVAPTFGWVEFNADSDPKPTANGIPSREDAEKLGMDILFQLGIDRSLISNSHSGIQTVQGKLSNDGARLSTNVISRGVTFTRMTDGFASQNSATFMANFENHAKVQRLVLSWRNLIPFESHPTLTKDELLQSIKSGECKLPLQTADVSQLDKATKLTVKEINIRYFDIQGYKPLDFSYPFAAVKVLANLEGTNTVTFYLECPILSTNSFK
jgi:hypothetical protein